jgi:hypothetical protein
VYKSAGALLGLLGLAASGCASLGGGPLPAIDPALARCDPAIAARLRFLEPRLADHARYARRWWMAWNGVYAGGIVFSGTMAGIEDGRGERADGVVSVAKSAIGLSENLLAPPTAKTGVEPLRAIATASPRGCERRLALAEELLRRHVADARKQRHSLGPHLENLALNLAGALIVAEGYDEGSGWSSGALGLVVGEIHIWTYPAQAEDTLKEYERRFRAPEPGDLGNSPDPTSRGQAPGELLPSGAAEHE